MQIKVTASLLLALGFVSGVVWLLSSRADAQLGAIRQGSASALPAPRSMVVFDSSAAPTAFPNSPFVPLNPGESITVATVPANRWLVITDYDLRAGWNVDLVEDLAGVVTVKRHELAEASNSQDRFHSSVGLSFAPGSKVALRNRGNNNLQMSFHLAGYWVAP